jgi:hypothetical protein
MMLTDIFPNSSSKPAQDLARLGARRRQLLAQERDELSALETAQAEHAGLERVIADSEAKALALGQDTPKAKAGPKLEKLAREVDARTEETDKLGRALLMLDEEARNLVTVHADELVAEAIAAHDHARERITELVAGLDAQAAALRGAYVAVQATLAAAGRNHEARDMRVPSSPEMMVREGGAPALMPDRVVAA